MTEKRERYTPSQAEMATMDTITAKGYLATIGTMGNERLLNVYWETMNQVAISGRELTKPEQWARNGAALEMLRRVDNRIFPAPALPDSVYRTWCRICRQEKPSNWEVDCGNGCAVAEPYGWVPEAGCPVHDADDADLSTEPGPFGPLDDEHARVNDGEV